MNPFFIIDGEFGAYYYGLFYLIAFLALIIILYYEGNRNKIPLIKLSILVGVTILCFIIGTKVITYSVDDWLSILVSGELPINEGKNTLGGILFGACGFMLSRSLLQINKPLINIFAYGFPLAIAIQRLGCLATGCCYGTPTSLPWGIAYGLDTQPFKFYEHSGYVDMSLGTTISVHPAPLYQSIYCILIVILIFTFRKRFKSPPSLFLFSAILFCVFVFLFEFLNVSINRMDALKFFGLSYLQYGLLVASSVLTYLLWKNEKRGFHKKIKANPQPENISMRFLLLGSAFLFLWLQKDWFEFVELLVIVTAFVPIIVAISLKSIKLFITPNLTAPITLLLVISLLFMGQNAKKTKKVIKPKPIRDSVEVYTTVGAGYTSGKYTLRTGGCNSPSVVFKNKYDVGGIKASKTIKYSKYQYSEYGANAFYGMLNESIEDTTVSNSYTIWGINPYSSYNWRWFGIGGGFYLGNLLISNESDAADDPNTLSKGTIIENEPVHLQFELRAGPYDWLYLDYRLNGHFPSSFPGPRHQISIGSGLSLINGTAIRYGSYGNDKSSFSGTFLGFTIPIENKIVINGFFTINKDDFEPTNLNTISIDYRFGHKKEKKSR